jgi:rRNA maturation endonuclease Nob1
MSPTPLRVSNAAWPTETATQTMTALAYEDDVNINGQRLLRKTEIKMAGRDAFIWALQCERGGCGHVYGTSDGDFDARACPRCGGGAPGL